MKKYLIIILSLVLLLTVSCGSSSTTSTPDDTGDTENGILGSFTSLDIDGEPVDESCLSGYELTMVNVWATYCAPCLNEMPDLGELAEEYEQSGVQIIGIITDVLDSNGNVSESQVSTAKDIVAATGADYLHIVPGEDLFGLLGQITAVPTTFFVDENGAQVGQAYIGSRSKSDWKLIIDQMLEEVKK